MEAAKNSQCKVGWYLGPYLRYGTRTKVYATYLVYKVKERDKWVPTKKIVSMAHLGGGVRCGAGLRKHTPGQIHTHRCP